jgi:8-oxo-dGTP pyrophosphatase MutT (NUDIX family)
MVTVTNCQEADDMSETIRAKALCLFRQGDRILVNQAHDTVKHQGYCRPLGGSIEFGETAAEALVREIREELGAEVVNLRQVGMLENLFVYNGSPGHEIMVIFDAQFADASLYDRPFLAGAESNGEPFQARWRDLDSFSDQLPLYPDGLLAFWPCARRAMAPPPRH